MDKTRGKPARVLKAFLEDERGQSTTEYILILFVVVMIAMKFRTLINEKMTNMVEKLGGKFDEALTD